MSSATSASPQVFKSSNNIVIEKRLNAQVRIIAEIGPITCDANSSMFLKIAYGCEYKNVPLFLYSLSMNNRDFLINHYISERSPTGITLAIENQQLQAITFNIQYFVLPIDQSI